MSAVRLGPVMHTKLAPRVTSSGRAAMSSGSDPIRRPDERVRREPVAATTPDGHGLDRTRGRASPSAPAQHRRPSDRPTPTRALGDDLADCAVAGSCVRSVSPAAASAAPIPGSGKWRSSHVSTFGSGRSANEASDDRDDIAGAAGVVHRAAECRQLRVNRSTSWSWIDRRPDEWSGVPQLRPRQAAPDRPPSGARHACARVRRPS